MDKEERRVYITNGLSDHYTEALETFKKNQIVGLWLQGSQNYNLDTADSDIDTKLIVTPTLREVAMVNTPISTTHFRANNEHTDWKDIRLYMETFRKQNLNFLEILFTDFFAINPLYIPEWNRLLENREAIAHMNPFRAMKSMEGIAGEKYHAMEHRYPSKIDIIDTYGYDGKQVHHLLRVEDYMTRYKNGEPYASCLKPTFSLVDKLMSYKLQQVPLEVARIEAKESLARIKAMAKDFCSKVTDVEDEEMRALLDDVCYKIIEISLRKELTDGLD